LSGAGHSAALLLTLVGGTVARAQQQVRTNLPPISVTAPHEQLGPGSNNQGAGSGAATNDKKGDGKAFEQLNRDLKRKVDEVNPSINSPPLNAASPDTKIGVVNIPGVQQQYGKNFGQSAVPFRPPPPVFVAPLGRH
jgi:hypothetical protein